MFDCGLSTFRCFRRRGEAFSLILNAVEVADDPLPVKTFGFLGCVEVFQLKLNRSSGFAVGEDLLAGT